MTRLARFIRWLETGTITVCTIEIRRGEPEPEPRSAPLWPVVGVVLSLVLLLASISLLATLAVLLGEVTP